MTLFFVFPERLRFPERFPEEHLSGTASNFCDLKIVLFTQLPEISCRQKIF